MLIEIKNRYTGDVMFSHDVEGNTINVTILKAIEQGADLQGADLQGADLQGADLRGADLQGAYLRGADEDALEKTPIFINELHWIITITTKHLTIGCQHHTHEQWAMFDEVAISNMDSHASAFWQVWKLPLLAMCAAHKL